MQFPYDTVAVAGETVEVVYVDFSTGLGFVLLVGTLWRAAKPHRHATRTFARSAHFAPVRRGCQTVMLTVSFVGGSK